jgi:hypothetical protein
MWGRGTENSRCWHRKKLEGESIHNVVAWEMTSWLRTKKRYSQFKWQKILAWNVLGNWKSAQIVTSKSVL